MVGGAVGVLFGAAWFLPSPEYPGAAVATTLVVAITAAVSTLASGRMVERMFDRLP
jgi:hypothetical protein